MKSFRFASVVLGLSLVVFWITHPTLVTYLVVGLLVALMIVGVLLKAGAEGDEATDRAAKIINEASAEQELFSKHPVTSKHGSLPSGLLLPNPIANVLNDSKTTESSTPLIGLIRIFYDHWLAVFASVVGLFATEVFLRWSNAGSNEGILNMLKGLVSWLSQHASIHDRNLFGVLS